MNRRKARVPKRQEALRVLNRWIFGAFFLSGLAGLMHEVVWAKLLVPLMGATAYAQTVVLGVFMGGLALGSVVFGRRADRSGQPLSTYVKLEFLIAAYCLVLPFLLMIAGLAYVSLGTVFFESGVIKIVLRFVLAILLVLPPAFLMGGTLPVLARHLVGRVEETQRQVARLYALNSLGAVLGAGLAGFITLPLMGVYFSLAVASLLNVLAGVLVWRLVRDPSTAGITALKEADQKKLDKASAKRHDKAPPAVVYRPEQYLVTLFALALSGFAAMGYEVLFTRIIGLSFGSSTYSFTVMLMSFVTGIALGSALVSRMQVKNPLWLLAVSQLAVVVALLAATPLVSRLPYLIALLRIDLLDESLGFELYQLGKAGLCLAILLLPTTCIGFSFPLVARVQARHPEEIGARVGSTYAWNTVGNVLGVAVTSLVLLPGLGLLGGFHFNLTLNFIAGLALLLVAAEQGVWHRVGAGAMASLVLAVYLSIGTGWPESVNFARNHLRLRTGPDPSLNEQSRALHPATSFDAWKETYVGPRAGTRYFFEEDAHTTVLVAGSEKNIQLFVNSKPDASTSADLESQLLFGHVPLFLAPNTDKVLLIGFGSGITSGAVMLHPVEHADIVEISSAVLNADQIFADHNNGVLSDPRVRTYLDDGQSFLRTVPSSYDIILSQPSNPWVTGIGALFTVEFFESVRSKLNPGGVFGLWFHTYEQSDVATQLILRTVSDVFPHVMLFGDGDLGNLIALASMVPIEPDFARMERRFGEPAIREDLQRLKIPNLLAFLSHHRVSQDRFTELVDSGPLNTRGHEHLEYMGPRSFFLRENSFFIEQFDPLVQGVKEETDVYLDRYIAYREAAGDPVSRKEFMDSIRYVKTIGGYGDKVAGSIGFRARKQLGKAGN
jgi:spermidine synthase